MMTKMTKYQVATAAEAIAAAQFARLGYNVAVHMAQTNPSTTL